MSFRSHQPITVYGHIRTLINIDCAFENPQKQTTYQKAWDDGELWTLTGYNIRSDDRWGCCLKRQNDKMLECPSKWPRLMGNRIHILGLLEHELTDEYTGVLPYTVLSTLNMFEIFYSEKKKNRMR